MKTPVQVLYLDGSVSLLKVNEGVVFELLDALQFAKLREGLLQQLLCDRRGQLTHKQHLDLKGQTILDEALRFPAFRRSCDIILTLSNKVPLVNMS